MTTSPKNTLQEYGLFDPDRISLPVYDSVISGGVAHSPLWTSTVTITLYQKVASEYEEPIDLLLTVKSPPKINGYHTKVEAEEAAANAMLTQIVQALSGDE